MFKVGLTGGIGSGKSCAAKAFANLGALHIDLDQISREVVEPGTDCLAAIVERFGSDILSNEQKLNRDNLRAKIFDDAKERKWLEQLLHPAIKNRYEETLEHLTDKQKPAYILVEIPLLAEGKNESDYQFDRVLVIDLGKETQIQRTMLRSNLERSVVEKILESQASRDQRLALADDVIDNSGTEAQLLEQVEALHIKYLQIAKSSA